MRIGVLALHGDFREHVETLRRLGAEAKEIRLPSDLDDVDGVIIPGGESTTITRLLDRFGLREPLARKLREGLPAMGTCAGAIILAKHAEGLDRPSLGVMDIDVRRNAFGRQVDSFEADVPFADLDQPFHAIFIRAPVIASVRSPARALAVLEDGTVVAAQQGSLIALAFHPELTADDRVHRYFLDLVAAAPDESKSAAQTAGIG